MYNLINNFSTAQETILLKNEAEALIEMYYTNANIQCHLAYPSDNTEYRSSYAFAIKTTDSPLPGINIVDLPPKLQEITKRIIKKLEIDQGRILFNIQRYKNNSPRVPRHIDGEILDYVLLENNDLKINKMIRPAKVALLTLNNYFIEGGTRIYNQNDSEGINIKYAPGDLLVFDNASCEHSVDNLISDTALNLSPTEYLRYVIGWRSLEDNAYLYEDGINKELSYDKAINIHLDYLSTIWPNRWKELQKGLF